MRHNHGKFNYNDKSDAFIKNHDLFISYSHNCSFNLAKILYGQLADQGLSVWWDYASLGYSNDHMSEIKKAIRISNNLLLLTSKVALKSPFVKAEWRYALRYRKNIVLGLCGDTSLRIPKELLAFPFLDLSTVSVCCTSIPKLCEIASEHEARLGPGAEPW